MYLGGCGGAGRRVQGRAWQTCMVGLQPRSIPSRPGTCRERLPWPSVDQGSPAEPRPHSWLPQRHTHPPPRVDPRLIQSCTFFMHRAVTIESAPPALALTWKRAGNASDASPPEEMGVGPGGSVPALQLLRGSVPGTLWGPRLTNPAAKLPPPRHSKHWGLHPPRPSGSTCCPRPRQMRCSRRPSCCTRARTNKRPVTAGRPRRRARRSCSA